MREVRLEAGFKIELTSLRTRRRVGCTVDKLLGVGGTAKVYSGITDDGHQVVLKAQRYEGQVDPSFEVEMELFKKLFHRNIVHCVGVAHTSGGHLVLGFRRAYQNPLLLLNRASVERRDRRATYPSLPIDTAIDFAYELLNSLDYLERLGFVHHDVKLANVLVDVAPRDRPLTGGEVFGEVVRRSYRGVLIDFGATRSRAYLEAWNRGEAPDGLAPLITPIYAPPESLVETRQADGQVRVSFDPSLDVYAAALVIYALITGHPPYSHLRTKLDLHDLEGVISVKSAERRAELTPIAREVISRVVFEDTRFVTGDRPSFDMALFRFLTQRLHPDPAQRGSAADMKREFERLACIRQLRDDGPPPSAPSARSTGTGTASASRPVFLPFQQELVVVGQKGGEHPLLRAARSFGVSASSAGSGAEAPAAPADGTSPPAPSPEPPTPTPEGETATASEDELDWLASIGSQDPSVTSMDADASWLDEMDATGTAPPAAPRAAGTRRLGPAPAEPPSPAVPSPAVPSPAVPSPASSGRARRPSESGSGSGEVPALPRGPVEAAARGARSTGSGRPPRPISERAPRQASASGRSAPRNGPEPPAEGDPDSRRARSGEPPSRAARAPARSLAERGPPPMSMGFAPHCLTGPALGEPVLLSRERQYVIGRDPGVELRIRSDLISRRHAQVTWTGEYFQLEDLGSLNGTLLNGERIKRPTPLHDGDRIGVGGFEIAVRTLQSGEFAALQVATTTPGLTGGETRLMTPEAAGPGAASTQAFAGELKKTGMRELVSMIESRRQAGTLDVRPPRGIPGKLFFRAGALVHAELGGIPSREAALRLLGLREGRFVFSGGDPRCPRSIDVPHEVLWGEVREPRR